MSLKQRLLHHFMEQTGVVLSGQRLAEHFQVSRTAIWKALHTLREEGVPIKSIPQVGYLVETKIDVLSANAIKQSVGRDLDVIYKATVDSTNAVAKRVLEGTLSHPVLVVADEQTAGRGRLGRTFVSPMKSGLYMSLALANISEAINPTLLTTMAAVAVSQALKEVANVRVGIKWVNDLYADSKKVCGILTEGIINMETQTIGGVVIGIGVNLETHPDYIPEELRSKIGGIYDNRDTANRATRNELAVAIVQAFYRLYDKGGDRSYLEEYRSRCFILGMQVAFTMNKKRVVGIAKAIDNEGALLVEEPNGIVHTLSYGEISIEWRKENIHENT